MSAHVVHRRVNQGLNAAAQQLKWVKMKPDGCIVPVAATGGTHISSVETRRYDSNKQPFQMRRSEWSPGDLLQQRSYWLHTSPLMHRDIFKTRLSSRNTSTELMW